MVGLKHSKQKSINHLHCSNNEIERKLFEKYDITLFTKFRTLILLLSVAKKFIKITSLLSKKSLLSGLDFDKN